MSMKKLLLSCLCLLGTASLALASEATFDFTKPAELNPAQTPAPYDKNGEGVNLTDVKFTSGDVTMVATGGSTNPRLWTLSGGDTQLRIYKGATITFESTATITGIVLNGGNTNHSKLSANIGSYAMDGKVGTWSGGASKVVLTAASDASTMQINSIVVTYTTGPVVVKKNAELAFSATSADAVIGEPFTAPTISKATTAAVAYSSSNESVATVAADGKVTILAVGTTTISATTEETDEYYAGSASYTLTVTAPVVTETGIPYEESFAMGIGSFVIENEPLPEGLSYVWSHDKSFKCMKASGYYKKAYATESWLISPTISLVDATSADLSFEQVISNHFKDTQEENATLWIKPEGGEWEWIEIGYPEFPAGKNFTDWGKEEISLAKYLGKKILVGFKYTSTDEIAGTWEIRNFTVSGQTAIGSIEAEDADAPVEYYNLQGIRVSGDEPGLYIMRQGNKVSKIIK